MLKDLSDDSIVVIGACAMGVALILAVAANQCLKTIYGRPDESRIENLEKKLDDIHRVVVGANR